MLRILVLSSTILTLVFSFGLGIWTLIINPKSKINRLWFLTMMAVSVWTLGYIFVVLSSRVLSEDLIINFTKVVYLGATLIPIFFFHFVLSFLYQQNKRLKFLVILGYLLAIIFLYLLFFTSLIINGIVRLENFGSTELAAFPGFYFYLIYYGFFSVGSLLLLARGFIKNDGIRKKQILFIIIAMIVSFGGASTNLSDSITGIYPYGQLVVWIFPLLITYGIFIEEIKLKIKF